ncbi:MAG: hypothetical protein RR756_06160 [Cetobacterium sp.]
MKLSNRKALIERAEYLMTHYSYDALTSLKIAEQEFEEQEEKNNIYELGEMQNDN